MPTPLPIRERGYDNPELLVETGWLGDHLSDSMLRIVDARADKDYARGHIPGAVHISGFALGGIRPGPEMPEPEAFAQLVGPLGIDQATPVVVYDDGGLAQMSQMAGNAGWTFLYCGHPDIRYLDGGLAKWIAEGLPLTSEPATHEPRTFSAPLMENIYCSLDQAKASVNDDNAIFWDVRTLGEFDGTIRGYMPPPRLGHIPGAIQLNYTEIFDADNRP